MAIFNITSNVFTSLTVEKINEISTDCATIYKYRITSDTGNDITINLTGTFESEYYYTTNEMDKTEFEGNVTIEYEEPFIVVFILSNSGTPGIFNSAVINIKNEETEEETYFYEIRENDNARCDATQKTIVPEKIFITYGDNGESNVFDLEGKFTGTYKGLILVSVNNALIENFSQVGLEVTVPSEFFYSPDDIAVFTILKAI